MDRLSCLRSGTVDVTLSSLGVARRRRDYGGEERLQVAKLILQCL